MDNQANASHTPGPWSTGHTPGPWQLQQSGHDFWIDTEPFGAGAGRMDIARVAWGHQEMFRERRANARLIAAAPDLLKACEDALSACVDPYGPVDRIEAADVLRAAIANAKEPRS